MGQSPKNGGSNSSNGTLIQSSSVNGGFALIGNAIVNGGFNGKINYQWRWWDCQSSDLRHPWSV